MKTDRFFLKFRSLQTRQFTLDIQLSLAYDTPPTRKIRISAANPCCVWKPAGLD
jgi:hypothetical protein